MYKLTINHFMQAIDQIDERQLFLDLNTETDLNLSSNHELKQPFSLKPMFKDFQKHLKELKIPDQVAYTNFLYYAGFENFIIDHHWYSTDPADRKYKFIIED